MKAPRPEPDYRPGMREYMQWEKEWKENGSNGSFQLFLMDKAADYAADVEMRLWSGMLCGVGFMHIAATYERERRPVPPKPEIHHNGFTYRLVNEENR